MAPKKSKTTAKKKAPKKKAVKKPAAKKKAVAKSTKKKTTKKKSPKKRSTAAKKAKAPAKKTTKKKAAAKSTKKKTTKKTSSKKAARKRRLPSLVPSATAGYQIKVKVFGIGGGGGNAISRMHDTMNTRSLELTAINTDAQDLEKSSVRRKVHIGKNLTRGLGTGMDPELGRQAAEENRSEIVEAVQGADLIFITAGLGGGTGSGAAPVVAEAARESGALTIAIVTKPFTFEGTQRSRIAEDALIRIRERVDALIVIPNDRVFTVIKKDTPILKAFQRIDDILKDAIAGITGLIYSNGIVNVDFSDVKTVMKDAGSALIGVGTATGKDRAINAATQAINSPLLEFSIEGAQGVLFGVSGGKDIRMAEVNEIAKTITATTDPTAKIIFGTYHDRRLKKGELKVTLIATGFNGASRPSTSSVSMLEPMITQTGPNLFGDLGATEETEEKAPEEKKAESGTRLINESVFTRKGNRATEARVKEPKKEERKSTSKKSTDTLPELSKDLPDQDKTDIWDIPAFLRKKRKDK